MLEKLTKLIPVVGAFVVLNGIIYLYTYYSEFHVDIFSFLDFTEILTAFIGYLPSILIFFSLYLVHLLIPHFLFDRLFHGIIGKAMQEIENDKYYKNGFGVGDILQWGSFVIIGLLLITRYIELTPVPICFLVFFGMTVVQSIVEFSQNMILEVITSDYHKALKNTIVFVFPFIAFTIVLAISDSKHVLKNSRKIVLTDTHGKITTYDRNIKFVGKAKDYIFVYDIKNHHNICVSLSNIKKIELYGR